MYMQLSAVSLADLFATAIANPDISPALLGRARSVAAEHGKLARQLSAEYDTEVAKRVGELSTTVKALKDWESASTSLVELQQLLQDPSTDTELRSLASEEIERTSHDVVSLKGQLQASLVPIHPFSELPCLLELRPGAGGSEAGLFAGDLLRMYQAYCKRHGLRVNLLKLDYETASGTGSESQIQEAILEVDGAGAYELLRCEAGVHRVQRVPATESKGRTHTSAVAVIVMPNFPSDGSEGLGQESFKDPASDFYVSSSDVRVDVMRARGAGGQHVNTTDSAVRLTHVPTGTVVAVQESRSQQQNRAKAWQILRARIAQAKREAREEELAQLRLSVVGVAKMGRGDKVRTYNWSQQRVTDHRSGITLHHLDDILEGGDSLDKIMDSVKAWLRERDVEGLIADEEAVAKASKLAK
ncbi:peptide chain release factor 1 [Physcia stellaris]|nr:peptide chain release factor 1 [Physcia stellaris]